MFYISLGLYFVCLYCFNLFVYPHPLAYAMRTLYEEKNCIHWRNEIAASNGDTRRLWRTFKDVLVTVLHSAKVGVDLHGTSYSCVAAVDARTASTLSLKKAAKSLAV